MDWDIKSTSVVIVGAGFSAAATDGKLPLMTGFFDRLQSGEFPLLHQFVSEVGCNQKCERIEQANVERVLVALDQIRTSPDALLDGWLGAWKANLVAIQEQIVSLYARTTTRIASDRRRKLGSQLTCPMRSSNYCHFNEL